MVERIYRKAKTAGLKYSFFFFNFVKSSGIYLVHLVASDSHGHCTWLLDICAWVLYVEYTPSCADF